MMNTASADLLLAESATRHRQDPLAPQLTARGYGAYRGYGELLDALAALVARGAQVVHVGRSVEGEPLWMLRFGPDDSSAATSVVIAGLHPNEWIGIETALELASRLLERAPERPVWMVPIANPDGLRRVEGNLRAGRRRFVRHNAHGVDLNRNFDARWGHKNVLARLIPWVFAGGQGPTSEPEVSAIVSALDAIRVDRALSLHSFGGVVLYPSAHRLAPVHDAAIHRRWARHIGAQASDRAYVALPSSWFGLGMTMGGLELDYFHERHGAISLLVECSRGGINLSPSRALDPFAWFNPPDREQVARRIARAVDGFVRGESLDASAADA